MPIEVYCDSCQKKLRVPDTAAGKRIKCPKCQGVLSVPAAESPAPAHQSSPAIPTPAKMAASKSSSSSIAIPTPKASVAKTSTPGSKIGTPGSKIGAKPTAENWFVQTEDGQQYGPVSRTELDAWYAEGRITAETQLLLEGGSQWQWATDVFPELAAAPAPVAAETGSGFPTFGEAAPSGGGGSGAFSFGESSSPSTSVSKGKRGKRSGGSGEVGDKSKIAAGLLGIFLGGWGVHNFYLGFTQKGVIQIFVTLFTCGVGSLWGLIEGIMILTGSINRDASGRRLRD